VVTNYPQIEKSGFDFSPCFNSVCLNALLGRSSLQVQPMNDVETSGVPSVKCSVPIRVSTVLGVVIFVGTLGENFGGAADVCAHPVAGVIAIAAANAKSIRIFECVLMNRLSTMWNNLF